MLSVSLGNIVYLNWLIIFDSSAQSLTSTLLFSTYFVCIKQGVSKVLTPPLFNWLTHSGWRFIYSPPKKSLEEHINSWAPLSGLWKTSKHEEYDVGLVCHALDDEATKKISFWKTYYIQCSSMRRAHCAELRRGVHGGLQRRSSVSSDRLPFSTSSLCQINIKRAPPDDDISCRFFSLVY